jgi:hypothetical protein
MDHTSVLSIRLSHPVLKYKCMLQALASINKHSIVLQHPAALVYITGRHHASRTCATRANVSRLSSLTKASNLWMCWSVRDVDRRPGRLSSVTLVLPSLKRSIHS